MDGLRMFMMIPQFGTTTPSGVLAAGGVGHADCNRHPLYDRQASQPCPINSSNSIVRAVSAALENTCSVTLFSITIASTSAMRLLSP